MLQLALLFLVIALIAGALGLFHAAFIASEIVNRLNDSFSASAALAGRELFLRGERHLYCIAEE